MTLRLLCVCVCLWICGCEVVCYLALFMFVLHGTLAVVVTMQSHISVHFPWTFVLVDLSLKASGHHFCKSLLHTEVFVTLNSYIIPNQPNP